METFLLKSKNRITENAASYSIHHCYGKDKYKIPVVGHFKNLISIKDCEIEPNMGILPHRHENMELITVLITGTLVQKNNLGETYSLSPGDVQVMNAGTGVSHFEYNKSQDTTLNCIQFCLIPNFNYTTPKSELLTLAPEKIGFQKILTTKKKNDKSEKNLNDVYLYYGFLVQNTIKKYHLKNDTNGMLILNISGILNVNGKLLENRDTLMLRNVSELTIISKEASKFFLIEI